MIAWVEGVLRDKAPTRVVVDVRGVGYELLVSLTTYAALPDQGKTVSLHVHTHMRSEAIQLFGFATSREREVFDLLLRTSRVGPKLAQTVLSGMDPEALLVAIQSSDVARLCKIPGVGRKLAERVVVELRERASELMALAPGPAGSPAGGASLAHAASDEAVSALVNLGYPRPKAERVIAGASEEAGEGATIETLIRAALRALAG